jgi:hypothetical protein
LQAGSGEKVGVVLGRVGGGVQEMREEKGDLERPLSFLFEGKCRL